MSHEEKKSDSEAKTPDRNDKATRRHFLRCSGGATAATVMAWHLTSDQVYGITGGSGGSGGSGSGGSGGAGIPIGGSGGSGGSGS